MEFKKVKAYIHFRFISSHVNLLPETIECFGAFVGDSLSTPTPVSLSSINKRFICDGNRKHIGRVIVLRVIEAKFFAFIVFEGGKKWSRAKENI